MTSMFRTGCCLAVAVAVSLTAPSRAEIIGADDFSEDDGTVLNGKASDVGGAWGAPGGLTIQGGIVDTALVGQHQGSFLDFTRPLAAGETLVLDFQSADSAGDTFVSGGGYAGISLFIGGAERVFIGDPGTPAVDSDGWALDGFDWLGAGNPEVYTGVADEAVTAKFTYAYDTGAYTFDVNGTVASGTGAAGMALDRIRIQSGSDDASKIAVDAFTVTATIPEPGAIVITALGLAGVSVFRRRHLG